MKEIALTKKVNVQGNDWKFVKYFTSKEDNALDRAGRIHIPNN